MDKYAMGRFLLHSRPFRPDLTIWTSAARSTGCNRRTDGHVSQVVGRIVVPVMDHATCVADPLTVGQRQTGVQMPARIAQPAGRKPAVGTTTRELFIGAL